MPLELLELFKILSCSNAGPDSGLQRAKRIFSSLLTAHLQTHRLRGAHRWLLLRLLDRTDRPEKLEGLQMGANRQLHRPGTVHFRHNHRSRFFMIYTFHVISN